MSISGGMHVCKENKLLLIFDVNRAAYLKYEQKLLVLFPCDMFAYIM